MRREHNIKYNGGGSYYNLPYEDNLVHFAPFTEGDISEHITGDTLVIDSGNTFIWNAEKQAYGYTYVNGGNYSGLRFPNCFYSNYWNSDKTQNEFTCMMDIYVDSTYENQMPVGAYYGGPWMCYMYRVPSGWHRVYGIKQSGSSTHTIYMGTTVVKSSQDSTGSMSAGGNGLHVISHPSWNGIYNVTVYIKNFIIWNKALTPTEVLAVDPHETTAPNTPTNVTAELNGSVSSVLVSWTASSSATSYNVYRSSSSGGTYTLLSNVNATSYIDNSPLTGMNYYKIIASNSYGNSDYSSAASVDTSVIPATPTGLTATAVYDPGLSAVAVELRWNPSEYANGYKYYRSTSAGGTYTLINTIGNVQVTDTPSAGITYYYKVSAINTNGESALSSYVSVDTSGTIPSAPTGLESAIDGSTIELRWNASSGATSYEVYRSTTSSGTYALVTTVTTTSASITALFGDNYIKVKAVNSVGSSDFSAYTYQNYSSEYTILNYIQSTGTQYINTSVSPTSRSSYSILIDCEFTQLTSGDQHAFGNDTCDVKINSSGNMTQNNVSTYLGTSRHSIQIDIEWNGNTYVKRYHVDGVQKTSYTSSWFANEAICVFGVLSYQNKKACIKVYSCSIQQNGVTTHEYYPVMRNYDGILGLYDNMTDTFKENSGTGTFLYG